MQQKFSVVLDMGFWGVVLSSISYVGRLYLPMFLFELIVDSNVYGFLACSGKAMPLPSYYAEVIHGGLMVSGGVLAIYWIGFFRCSWYLSQNILMDSPTYSSLQSTMSHLYQYVMQLLHCMGSFYFGYNRMFLIVQLPLKHVLIQQLPHLPLIFLQGVTLGNLCH